MATSGVVKKLLFVCAGNTCRSPMAMRLAQHLAPFNDKIQVDSAAAKNPTHTDMAPLALAAVRQVLEREDIPSHKVQKVTKELIDDSDCVIVMGTSAMSELKKIVPAGERDKLKYLLNYEDKGNPSNKKQCHSVPDPFDGDSWNKCYGVDWPGKSGKDEDIFQGYVTVATSLYKDWLNEFFIKELKL